MLVYDEPMQKTWEEQFHQAIVDRFEHLKSQNPNYSVRAFAKKARLSSGAMSQFLKKKQAWRLTPKRALEVLGELGFEESQKIYFAALMGEALQFPRKLIPEDKYEILKDWISLPVLHSFDLKPPPSSVELARRLGVSVEKVEEAILNLKKHGFLRADAEGKLFRDQHAWQTSDGPAKELIRQHHKMNLMTAERALDVIPADERYFLDLTFVGNRKQLGFLKTEIRKLFDRAAAVMEDDSEANELFKLSVGLFPLDFDRSQQRD